PFGPRVTSNSTVSPSARVLNPSPWMAEKCTNTSSPPSWEMKPKPFASLNHFTVPRATLQLLVFRTLVGSLVDCRCYAQRRRGFDPATPYTRKPPGLPCG